MINLVKIKKMTLSINYTGLATLSQKCQFSTLQEGATSEQLRSPQGNPARLEQR
jgi:hypothetical protein